MVSKKSGLINHGNVEVRIPILIWFGYGMLGIGESQSGGRNTQSPVSMKMQKRQYLAGIERQQETLPLGND